MVILNSQPEDVNFYQENTVHDVGHDYFGSGNRVKKFEDMKKMVDNYLSTYEIQSGGRDRIATDNVTAENIIAVSGLRDAQSGSTIYSNKEMTPFERIVHNSDPVVTTAIEAKDKSDTVKKLKKRLKTLSLVEEISFSEYMEQNIRPILQNVFYQLHFYYYTLRLNIKTLNFDKDVPESVFGDELKSTGNSAHENMYNKFVMLCWNLFNKRIGNLEKYKKLTTQDLVTKDNWVKFWKYLEQKTQYGGAVDGDDGNKNPFECKDNGDRSFTITPVSIDGTKFIKAKTVRMGVTDDNSKYEVDAKEIPKIVGRSTDKDGIIAWIQKNVTNSKPKNKDSDDVIARKNQVNNCINTQVDRIVGNLSKLSASASGNTSGDTGRKAEKSRAPATPATSVTSSTSVTPAPDSDNSSIPPAPRKKAKRVTNDDGSSDTDTSDDDKVKSTSNQFIMIVMAWFYQNFIGDYGDTMNHFLRAENDVFELFKKTPVSNWTLQDENIIRTSQHIVSSHSKSIIEDDLSNEDSMCNFRSELRTLPDGTRVSRYLIDNAGKEFHLSSGNAICPLSSMMDGITIQDNAVECLPLKSLPLDGNQMKAPEIGNMAVYLRSVEKRDGEEYKRNVELERYISGKGEDKYMTFKASFVGNGSNGKDQTFTATMTLKPWEWKIEPIFAFKYDDNNLNLTQDRLRIDPDLVFDNAVIVAGDIFHCATNSLIALEKDVEFQGWKSDVSANKEKIISRMVLSAYCCLIFKSFGDILQEWNAVLKGGGYVKYGKNIASGIVSPIEKNGNHVWQAPFYGNDVAENERFTERNLEPVRVIVCGDRPSATRVLWSLYNAKKRLDCNSDWSSWINSNCTGGYMYRELNTPTGTQTLGDEGPSDTTFNVFNQPVNIGRFSIGTTKSFKNYFMYNPGKETSYTFETSNFILDNALAGNGKNVSIAFNKKGNYEVTFGNSTFTFNKIAYPGKSNQLDRQPHPIVFNLISEWLFNNDIDISGNNNDNVIVTSMKQGSMLCYRKVGINLNDYYIRKLDKQIADKQDELYTTHQDKINNYLNNNNVKCMISSLNKGVNKAFRVYLVPSKFEKAYDSYGNPEDADDINPNTIFTVENCDVTSSSSKNGRQSRTSIRSASSTRIPPDTQESTSRSRLKRRRQQQSQVGNTPLAKIPRTGDSVSTINNDEVDETDNQVASINGLILSPAKSTPLTPPLTPGSPLPLDALSQDNAESSSDETQDNRVFTIRQIKDALLPVAGINYDTAKKKFEKFDSDMTFEQIKNVTLPKDVNKDAFYKNLLNPPSSSMQGGAVDTVEENMNPLVYAVVSVGALDLL